MNIQTHTITIGDSLQKIARLYGVDDWRDIAQLNNLHTPYIDSVFQSTDYEDNERVAKIGDIILIPNLASNTVITKRVDEEIEALAYGIDLDLYNGETAMTEKEGALFIENNDIALAQGMSNLAQQLTIRLSTKKGALLLHPEFGSNLYKYNGKLDNTNTKNKIVFEVESCLRSDFRVKEVNNIDLETKDGAVYVVAKIVPIEPGQPFKLYKFIK